MITGPTGGAQNDDPHVAQQFLIHRLFYREKNERHFNFSLPVFQWPARFLRQQNRKLTSLENKKKTDPIDVRREKTSFRLYANRTRKNSLTSTRNVDVLFVFDLFLFFIISKDLGRNFELLKEYDGRLFPTEEREFWNFFPLHYVHPW